MNLNVDGDLMRKNGSVWSTAINKIGKGDASGNPNSGTIKVMVDNWTSSESKTLTIAYGIIPKSSGSTKSVSYRIPFKNDDSYAIVAKRSKPNWDWDKSSITEQTSTGFTIKDESSSTSICWLAIGE